jgi:hypothetical protein
LLLLAEEEEATVTAVAVQAAWAKLQQQYLLALHTRLLWAAEVVDKLQA